MKRLTIRNSDGSVSQPTHSTFEKVFNRLADYEDIGLEPQEIMAAIQIKHGHVYQYPTVFGKDFEDVKKLIDAEEQGSLVRLPCKVGDTVWFKTYKNGERVGIKPHRVEKIKVLVQLERGYAEPFTEIQEWEFGKTVFTSREAAEKALEEVCRKNT